MKKHPKQGQLMTPAQWPPPNPKPHLHPLSPDAKHIHKNLIPSEVRKNFPKKSPHHSINSTQLTRRFAIFILMQPRRAIRFQPCALLSDLTQDVDYALHGPTEYLQSATALRWVNGREYELKDHLGNIRLVVTDHKMSNLDGQSLPEAFQADVLVMRDYYPFGMEMPGQVYVGAEYRYGFQGHGAR